MRNLKILGYVLGGLIALFAMLLIAVSLFVNPNDYKARISREVKAATGRDLTMRGDIKLSVFPWVALELGPLSLGNPQGFDSEPFLSLQHAALRVKLLPLLRKDLQIGRIEVEGLDLRLRKNAAGKGNWENIGRSSTPQSHDEATRASGPPASLEDLGGVLIKDSRISYNDLTVSNLNIEIGNLTQRTIVPVKTSFNLDTGTSGARTSFTGALNVMLDTVAKQYQFSNIALSGDLVQKAQTRTLSWKFAAPAINVDVTAQNLNAAAFSAQVASAQLSGELSGEKVIDAPALTGKVKLEPLQLRVFLTGLGIEMPTTRDAKALSELAAATEFSYAGNALRLDKLDLRLDDSQLRGVLGVSNLDTKSVTFDLNVDQIDLDRYLAPAGQKARSSAKPEQKPTELPTTPIKSLIASGNFSIGSAKVAGLALSKLGFTLQAKDGIVHLVPIKASLYGGDFYGDLTYDAHDAVPSVTVEQQVTGVDIAPMLRDSFKIERLSGRGNVRAKLSGSGHTSDALIRNLTGRVDANLTNGAVNGIDLWFEISRAQALLAQRPVPMGADDRRTKFDTFKMSADIANGVAATRDMAIASPYLRVTGTGSSNLISEAIDYHLVATVLRAPPSAAESDLSQLTLADIPVEISGTMTDPKVRPDLQGILKSKIKQKLQDTLKDKLQDIFGR